MRKKLIAAIIAALLMLAAAIGVIIYMERDPSDPNGTEATEETVGLSLPTENPDEVTPEDAFDVDDYNNEVPSVTAGSEDSGETESLDDNETPHDIF